MASNWHVAPLRELVGFISKGIAPSYAESETETTIRVLNQKCNRNYHINYSESRLHDIARKKVSLERYVKPDDILINSTGTGTAGRIAQIDEVPCATTVDGHMIIIRSNKRVTQKYLGYALKNHQREVLQLDEGSTGQTELNRDRLLNEIMISYPDSLLEQEEIVRILEGIEQKTLINQKINDNLEQQAQAIYKSWFVDFEPFGGQIPATWAVMTLDQITSLISRGITPKYSEDSDQIVLNQKCIRNHNIDLTPARSHTPKAITEKWLQFGDLLINSTGTGTLGRVAQVLFSPNNMTVDSHITIVRPSASEYVYFIGLWGTIHETEIESLHTGSTGQTELPRERIKSMRLLVPDNAALKKFNDLVSTLSELRIQNQRENLRLASIRDSLLPRLMSGELDVSNINL